MRKDGERIELISRNGNPMNDSFPDLIEAIAAVPGSFVWDAELTVDDANGRSSFERLQIRARTRVRSQVSAAARLHPARLYIFDVLASGQLDVRKMRLLERKAMLRESFEDTTVLIYPKAIVTAGEWVFEQTKQLDLESLMAKRLDSPYQAGARATG